MSFQFDVAETDRTLSPKTGLVRRHWLSAAHELLDRYFAHIDPQTGLFFFPGPNSDGEPAVPVGSAAEIPPGRRFEAFTRVFLLAAPVLDNTTETLVLHGRDVRQYFAEQFERFCDPSSPDYAEIAPTGKSPYQLVQWSAIVLALLLNDEIVFGDLNARQQTLALDHLSQAAHHRTNAHNWRYFNLLAYLFLHRHERPVDAEMERDHLLGILSWDAGNGWYRDGGEFDYYNAWAFQSYAPVWLHYNENPNYRDIEEVLRRRFALFMETYPRFFSRHGHSLLWGRSSLYRFAASTPFVTAQLLPDPVIDGGFARRIASGNLIQFLAREDVFVDGVPNTGFYGSFEPARQRYSRATSFGWMHKLFAALSLPQNSPFWTNKEHDGFWTDLGTDTCITSLDGPGLTLVNHGRSGSTVLVPGKTRGFGKEPYTRLAYHSELLWEADADEGASAAAYSVVNREEPGAPVLCTLAYRYVGFSEGVLYRQAVVGGEDPHFSEQALVDLAEVHLPDGVLRVDRIRVPFPYELRLGSWGVPADAEDGLELSEGTVPISIHVVGPDRTRTIHRADWARVEATVADYGAPRNSTFVGLYGWDRVEAQIHRGRNAERELSAVPAGVRLRETAHRGGVDLCVSCHLFRHTQADIGAVLAGDMVINTLSPETGSPFMVRIVVGGVEYTVDFGAVEGGLSC